MLMLKKICARGALFLRGDVQLAAPRPARPESTPRLSYADVRLASLGLALQRQGLFNDWLDGGRE